MPRKKKSPLKRNVRHSSGSTNGEQRGSISNESSEDFNRAELAESPAKRLKGNADILAVKSMSTTNLQKHINLSENQKFLLDAFNAYIRVFESTECKYKIGQFVITVNPDFSGNFVESIYGIYIGNDMTKVLCIAENSSDGIVEESYHSASSCVPVEILHCLSTKYFSIQCAVSATPGMFLLDVYLTEINFPHISSPSISPDSSVRSDVKRVVQFFSGNDITEKQPYRLSSSQDYSKLLDAIVHESPCDANVQHPNLIPQLRPYQKLAVQWMLSREQKNGFFSIPEMDAIHPLFSEFTTLDGAKLYYNKTGGYFSLEPQYAAQPCLGGILADEMGLGKTVEVLACILNNPKDDTNSQAKLENERQCTSSTDESLLSDRVFSCCCGEIDYDEDDFRIVKCDSCGVLQHADCFNYVPLKLDDVYYCPHCWLDDSKGLVSSHATLIISPHRICYQWEDEIRKHIKSKSLKILNYQGLGHHNFLQPHTLAQYDIVLTTYEVLRKELNYVDLPYSSRKCALRQPQKYYSSPSPLPAVLWWRVCLDEAQMAENATSSTAKMALKLNSVHRWCVTGTPVQKNVNDLYGLLLFVGCDPYCFRIWWKEAIYVPFCNGNPEPLLSAFYPVLWRTLKKNVIEQINIPRQDSVIHWINFSQVESYFYKEQNANCLITISRYTRYENLNIKLKCLSKDFLNKVWNPVKLLRKACCHPQMVKGQFTSSHKSYLSMSEVLDVLIRTAQHNAEDAHRQLIGSINGLAGLSIITMEYTKAISYYKKAVSSAYAHRDCLKTDKIQLYHAFYNMASLLHDKTVPLATIAVGPNAHSESKENVETNLESDLSHVTCNTEEHPIIREPLSWDMIAEEAEKIKSAYLQKTLTAIESTRDQLNALNQEEADLNGVLNSRNPWWICISEHAVNTDKDSAFVEKLSSDLQASVEPGRSSIANQFRDINGLCYVTETLLGELRKSHDALKVTLLSLPTVPREDDVISAASCHLRRPAKQHTRVVRCKYCKIQEQFNSYESNLFRCSERKTQIPYKRAQQLKKQHHSDFSDEDLADEPQDNLQGTQGTWADSELERVLKAFLIFGRNNQVPAEFIEEGNKVLQWMSVLKKEFRAFRNLWMKLSDHVSAVDELNMASQRFRLKLSSDVADPSINYIIDEDQVSTMKQKFLSDKTVTETKLKECLLKLFYLQNLKKLETEGNGENDASAHICPVCRQRLRSTWTILSCGHSVCNDCLLRLMKDCALPNRPNFFRCPICRDEICRKDVYHVGKQTETEMERKYPVLGNFSSKVTAIVRCLMQIKEEDPSAKTLVFSEWQDLLNILVSALQRNGIHFVPLFTKKKFQTDLLKFKMDPEVNTALLPIYSCASGLNIIEATHVILAEPLLHTSWELQAIGRVHRIGQTKETTIHRFIVKDSIEEKVYRLLPSGCQSDEEIQQRESCLTLRDLHELF